MVFRARDEAWRVALAQGHALIMAAINDEPFDVQAAVARVRTEVDDQYLGPSTRASSPQRPTGAFPTFA